MKLNFRLITAAAILSLVAVQPTTAEADMFKKMGKKLEKKKKDKKKEAAKSAAPAAPKPYEQTATGFGKGDQLVVSIDSVVGGTCRRAPGATAYKVTFSAVLWTKGPTGPERFGPMEITSEDIAPLNPKQVFASTEEIRIPIEQINAAFEELGFAQAKAAKSEIIGSTLGIGIDPVGPCSKLIAVPYRGYSFVTPSVYLDFPNPYHTKIPAGESELITVKPLSVSVLDNDAARLGESQGGATRTLATVTVRVEDK